MTTASVTGQEETTVLFLDRHSDGLIAYIERGLNGLPVKILMPPDDQRESLLPLIPDAEILIGWRSDLELLESAGKMKLFINPGTGIAQHLDNFRAIREMRNAVLVNGHGNSYSVAQLAVSLVLALTNKVVPYHLQMANGGGHVDQRTTYLKDITVGFLGYGAINKKVHRFLAGFDVSFSACRYSWDSDRGPLATEISRYSADQVDEFFEAADIVICALPETTRTYGIVTLRQLTLLGERGLFINVGRGSAVIEEDMYNALKDKVIAGAAIEVWWRHPRLKDAEESERRDPYAFPFHELDNIVMSPHRGADCGGNLDRWDEVIENIKRVHAGREDYLNVVDLDREY